MLNNRVSDKYTITLRNKFDAFQEISETLTPNDKYKNFLNAYIEARAECIPTKLRAKHRTSWEILVIKRKHDDVKIASQCNKRDPNNGNAQKLKKAQSELSNAYQNEQIECIQDQVNKIRHPIEDRQSQIAWQTVNEVNKRKSTARVKLKPATQEERIHVWKEHFKNLLRKPSKVTDKRISKINDNQVDIKLG